MDKHYAFLSLISWICLSIGATFIYVTQVSEVKLYNITELSQVKIHKRDLT